MRIGGPADYFAEPSSEKDLFQLLAWADQEGLPFYILGNGSNVIFADEGFQGLVIAMGKFQREKMIVNLQTSCVTVTAGISLARFVAFCQEQGLAGVEFLAQIPGTIGGALVMNAGFSRYPLQRNEIGDLVRKIKALRQDGNLVELSRSEMEFSYRHSNLNSYILLEATFQLWHRPKDIILAEIEANRRYRQISSLIFEPNAGSIFKNPDAPHPSAGVLIDRAGLKGKRIGGIQVSEQHANYFINKGGATCADVLCLLEEVQKTVFHATGITLEPEIQIIPHN